MCIHAYGTALKTCKSNTETWIRRVLARVRYGPQRTGFPAAPDGWPFRGAGYPGSPPDAGTW